MDLHDMTQVARDLSWNTDMLASALILTVTFAGIFTEGLHHIHRTKVALAGAASMVLAGQFLGFYDPHLALKAVDWNVVLLLGAMMVIIGVMIPTGGFQAIAEWNVRASKGRLFTLLFFLGTAVTVLSTLLNNVTTVAIFAPLIILSCQSLRVSPVPILLATAMLSNVGGVATLVGDPPNLMIGSAAGIGFNMFLARMGGIVFVAWLATLGVIWIMFRGWARQKTDVSSLKAGGNVIEDKRTWYVCMAVLGIMIALFTIQEHLQWEAWAVAAFGMAAVLLFAHNGSIDKILADVELSLLLFFISLFVVIGGVEHSHFLEYIGQQIKPFAERDLLMATIALLWVAAIFSALIDNIPFTAAMIPIILGMSAGGINAMPLWWALAIGVGLGGNGTHIGATANIFVVTLSEKLAEKEGDPSLRITPGLWLRKGLPAMIASLVTSTIVMWLFFDFFSS